MTNKIKTFISILLSILIVLSSLSAFASEETSFSKDLSFFNALNLVSETVSADTLITRYDLSRLYYGIVTGSTEEMSADYPSVNFTDVDEEHAVTIDFVYRMGLMNGIGGGLFNPDGKVTYDQLIKTMMSFLGYDEVAKSKGGYPIGYHITANSLDITPSIAVSGEQYVSYSLAEDVFLKASGVDVADMLNDELTIQEGTTYLSRYRNIVSASGVVTADNFSDKDNSKSEYWGRVKINSVDFVVLEGAKGIVYEGGRNVNFMYRENGRYKEIVYYEKADSKEITILPSDIVSVSDSKIIYIENNREQTLKYNLSTAMMYNGQRLKSFNTNDINPFKTKDGYLRCVDNDFDGVLDYVYITAYEIMIAGKIRDGVVYSKLRIDPAVSSAAQSIDLDGLDEGALLNAQGNTMNWEDIREGDVLCYEREKNTGKINRVYMVINQGEGIIEEIGYEDGYPSKVVVSGIEYYFGKSTRLNPDISKVKVGTKLILYFGIQRNIADFEILETSGMKIAYLTEHQKGDGLDDTIYIRVFSIANEFEVYPLAEKVKYNYQTYTAQQIIDNVLTVSAGNIKRQLIKYTLNDKNEINSITLAGGDYFKTVSGMDGTVSLKFTQDLNTFQLKAFVSASTKVFVVPQEADRDRDEMYSIRDYGVFGSGSSYLIEAYNSDETGRSKFIEHAVYKSASISSGEDFKRSYPFIAIEKIATVVDSEGESRLKLTGFGMISGQQPKYGEFYAESTEVYDKTTGQPINLSAGDVIKVERNSYDRIGKAELILDYSECKLVQASISNPLANNPSRPEYPLDHDGFAARYSFGKVVSKLDGYLTVELVSADGTVTEETYPVGRFDMVYDVNERDGKIKSSTAVESLIYDEYTYGDDCSYVFTFIRGPYFIGGVVYNK